MEAIALQNRHQLLARYHRLRKVSRKLNKKLPEKLNKDAIEECGRRLGIFKRGVLCFDSEETATVLIDYGIHQFRCDGLNAVERYLLESPPRPESDEMTLLCSMCEVRYGILRVEDIHPGVGVLISDVLRDESGFLVDVGLSLTAKIHCVLASHFYSPDGFWMTTGAVLPMNLEALEEVLPKIEGEFGSSPEQFCTLDQEQQSELATLIIRTCLQTGMPNHIAYRDTDGTPTPRPHSGQLRRDQRVGRNDRCPCGSGRKFKNCCRP